MQELTKNSLLENAILYFHDSGCSLCFTEKQVVADLAAKTSEVVPTYSVNMENNAELAKKYAIYSAPSVVFIKNQQKVDQFNKYLDKNQLATAFNYYFGGLRKND